jgi:hypothetical protein
MERKRRGMDAVSMQRATHVSRGRMESILKLAENFTRDPEREKRVEDCLCKSCFYVSRVGGAAITQEPCMCCGEMQTYGSTNTDALCLSCARETGLCKHCGGDRELRTRRKTWPTPKHGVQE